MEIALHIEQFSKPIVAETHRVSYVPRFLWFLLGRIKQSLHKYLDNIIVAVEGYYFYANELNIDGAKSLLVSTKKVLYSLDKIDDELRKIDYFNDDSLKVKFDHMLKSIYKLENILHKIVYKNAEKIKTPVELIEGVARMNKIHLEKLLAS